MGGEQPMAASSPTGTSLPPRRAAGQQPLSSMPPGGSTPGWTPPQAGLGLGMPPMDPSQAYGTPVGNPPTQTQSRLIPGAPSIPNMGPAGGPAMTNSLPGGSLFGRDMPAAPLTPATQALNPATQGLGGGLSLGGHLNQVSPASPLPAGRNLAALRPTKGGNFIRLGIAALFLLGFLGLAGYFLKDTITGLLGSNVPAEPEPKSSVVDNIPVSNPASPGPKPVLAPEPASNGLTDTPKTTPELAGRSPLPTAEAQNMESAPTAPTPGNEEIVVKPAQPTGAVPELANTPTPSPQAPPADPPKTQSAPPTLAGGSSAAGSRSSQTDPLDEKPTDKVPTEAEPAFEALKGFLGAASADERVRYVLGADFMKPLIERYYSRNNDGPIVVDHISFGRYDKQPDLGSGAHCIFHIESKTWEYPVPAMLEEQADGWKVDWLTFIELKDRKLEEFFKTYQEGKAMFHVGIFRQHYFGDEVPNRDQKDAFSIGLPRPNPFRAPVFLSKDAQLSRELRDRLPWEVHVWAVVELEWKKLGSQQWVELVSMPQMHWYSVPATPRPISTSEKPPLEAPAAPAAAPANSQAFPPGIRRSPAGSAPTIQKAVPVPDQPFPPGIRRSPASR